MPFENTADSVAVLKRIDLVQRVLAVQVRFSQRELHILCEQDFPLMAKRLPLMSKDDRVSSGPARYPDYPDILWRVIARVRSSDLRAKARREHL